MRPLSIAIFGNTNNYPLLLGQGLKSLGHNVRLIFNRKEILHRPEARYPDWAGAYPEWVFDCSNITDEDIAYQTPAIDAAIHHLTHNVDLVILNDTGPALAGRLHAPHVVVLTGSDLAYYASYDSLQMRTRMWDLEFKRSLQGRRYLLHFSDFVARQRDGILAAETVCYCERGLVPAGDRLLDEIGVQDRRRLMLYISNTIDLKPGPMPKNNRLTILCGSRIVYRPDRNPALGAIDFKGTDVLINGFAGYIQAGGRGILRLPKKGQDLDAAISLVADHGIETSIDWLDEMPVCRFYDEMLAADLICDQIGNSIPGMVTTDAYALGRPVLANLRNEIFKKLFPEPLPGFDVKTPKQVTQILQHLEQNPMLLAETGQKSRLFAEHYLSPSGMAGALLRKAIG
ncbi:MAG: hypothetical protein EBZ61_09125 [Micrococcales bacterium]|nr:hypothetical protein [Micrococcales bacterium]